VLMFGFCTRETPKPPSVGPIVFSDFGFFGKQWDLWFCSALVITETRLNVVFFPSGKNIVGIIVRGATLVW
jgi:hypothetical protein